MDCKVRPGTRRFAVKTLDVTTCKLELFVVHSNWTPMTHMGDWQRKSKLGSYTLTTDLWPLLTIIFFKTAVYTQVNGK